MFVPVPAGGHFFEIVLAGPYYVSGNKAKLFIPVLFFPLKVFFLGGDPVLVREFLFPEFLG